jgi:hypothetical protein
MGDCAQGVKCALERGCVQLIDDKINDPQE